MKNFTSRMMGSIFFGFFLMLSLFACKYPILLVDGYSFTATVVALDTCPSNKKTAKVFAVENVHHSPTSDPNSASILQDSVYLKNQLYRGVFKIYEPLPIGDTAIIGRTLYICLLYTSPSPRD